MSENGQLLDSELRDTVIGGQLASAASKAADRLALAFALKYGRSLMATDTYRTIADQRELARTKPALAAPPGTSRHGLGLAIDFASDVPDKTSSEHKWMNQYGPRYGWVWPLWARKATRFEPWHREYDDNLDMGGLELKWPKGDQCGLGMSSNYVTSLQKFLNHMFPDKPQMRVDGDFWMATYAAVYRFQERVDIPPTGVVGDVTKYHLKRYGFPVID